jgi:hypothetical protein
MKSYLIIAPLIVVIALAASTSILFIDQQQANTTGELLRTERTTLIENTTSTITDTTAGVTTTVTDTTNNTTTSGTDESTGTSGDSTSGSNTTSGSATTGTNTTNTSTTLEANATIDTTPIILQNDSDTSTPKTTEQTVSVPTASSPTRKTTTYTSASQITVSTKQVTTSTAIQQQKSVEDIRAVSESYTHTQTELDLLKTELKTNLEVGFNETLRVVAAGTSTSDTTVRKLTDARKEILADIEDTFTSKSVADIEKKLKDLVAKVDTAFDTVDPRSTEKIYLAVSDAQNSIAESKKQLEQHGGLKIYADTDKDGISDYDEEVVYGTNPRKAFTVAGELNDGQKVLQGIDPRSTSTARIAHEEPETTSTIVAALAVNTVAADSFESSPDGSDIIKSVAFKGKALPNSIITLYIYSTPIIVAVKADNNGDWAYVLDQELENGDHKVYAAVVNNSGKVLARSNPLPFVKEASAITLDQADIMKTEEVEGGFMRTYLFWIAGSIVLLGLIVTLIIVGLLPKNRNIIN